MRDLPWDAPLTVAGKFITKAAIGLALVLCLTIAVNLGMTAVIVVMSKETQVSEDGILRKAGSDTPVRVSSAETDVSATGKANPLQN